MIITNLRPATELLKERAESNFLNKDNLYSSNEEYLVQKIICECEKAIAEHSESFDFEVIIYKNIFSIRACIGPVTMRGALNRVADILTCFGYYVNIIHVYSSSWRNKSGKSAIIKFSLIGVLD